MLEGVTLRNVDRLLGLHRVDQHRVVKLHQEIEGQSHIIDLCTIGRTTLDSVSARAYGS